MQYETSYNFCFPNKHLWEELVQAQREADGQNIKQIVQAQYDEIGSEVRQFDGIATDPDIFNTRSKDLIVMKTKPDFGLVSNYQEELDLVVELSQSRDLPISSLGGHIPESLRKLSWFLEDVEVTEYAAGLDFGGQAYHERVYAGKQPEGVLVTGGKVPITTGRHIASLVHSDHPVKYAIGLIGKLDSLGIEHRNCPHMEDTRGLTRFASVGGPFITGAMGEVLRRVGLVSFREKWNNLQPRPAQSLAEQGVFLMHAFPELHPSHPSRNAMHFIAYAAMAGYIKHMYNQHQILPNGNNVETEVDLWRDNFGDGRCWAGVHTRVDHAPYLARAEKLGEKIAKEHLA